jgi:urease accessory protein
MKIHEGGTVLYSEMIAPGRVARGESFQYDICYMKVSARDQNDKLRFIDTAMLEPKKRNMKTLGILGTFDIIGNAYILTKKSHVRELKEEISSSLQKFVHVSGGTSVLPHDSGVLVRMLGNVASDIRDTVHDIIRITRRVILNAPFSGIRKC